jgi:hypothetical protein
MDYTPTAVISGNPETPVDPVTTFNRIINEGAAIDQSLRPIPTWTPASTLPTTPVTEGEQWPDGATVGSEPPVNNSLPEEPEIGQPSTEPEEILPGEKVAELETKVNQLKQELQSMNERLISVEAMLTDFATGSIDKQFASAQLHPEQPITQTTAPINSIETPSVAGDDANRQANQQQQQMINDYLNNQN